MRVLFVAQVLNDPHRYGSHIEAIVERFYSGQHQWVIEDLDEVLRSNWMKGRATWSTHDTFAEKIHREGIDHPSTSGHRRLLVVDLDESSIASAPSSSLRALPSRARQILEKPLFLIVENAESDGAFVGAISALYVPDLQLAIERQWLKPEHAGGKGELIKRVNELLATGVPAWRIAVLMDSDRLAPGLLPAANAKIQERLEERGIRVFPLFKREAENYLPTSLLGEGLKVRVFLDLSPVQRDHFDMKKGFKKEQDGTVIIPDEQQELYEKLSTWQLNQLAGGFGHSIGDRFKGARLSSEEMSFVCQTHPEELEHLLSSLQEMI